MVSMSAGANSHCAKGVFAHLRARRAQQLVQAVGAEEIQIRRIDVMCNVEPFAGGPAATPLIAQALEPGAVECHGALRAAAGFPDALVMQECRDECRNGNQKPLRRNPPNAEA